MRYEDAENRSRHAIDGTDTAQLIQQRYPAGMTAELAIPIITAVASALDYAHKKGLQFMSGLACRRRAYSGHPLAQALHS